MRLVRMHESRTNMLALPALACISVAVMLGFGAARPFYIPGIV